MIISKINYTYFCYNVKINHIGYKFIKGALVIPSSIKLMIIRLERDIDYIKQKIYNHKEKINATKKVNRLLQQIGYTKNPTVYIAKKDI